MEITFIDPSLKTGGGLRVLIDLANVLAEENRIQLVTANDGGENTFFLSKKVKNIVVGPLIKHKFLRMFDMVFMMWRYRKRICVVSGPELMPLMFWFRHGYYYLQGDEYRQFDDRRLIKNKYVLRFYKYLIKRAYKYKNVTFIFNARWVYEQYLQDSMRKDIPYRLVLPSIDHDVFSCQKDAYRDFTKETLRIGFVARLHPCKGFQEFLDAYKLLKTNVEVVLASPDDLSGFSIPVDWEIVVPKSSNDMSAFYHSCDIFICASWWEGFGLPALEAMACGCAVITTDNGGCREYARDNENCLMVEPHNIKALAEKVDMLLSNRSLCRRLMAGGLHTAGKFNYEKSAETLLSIIREQED